MPKRRDLTYEECRSSIKKTKSVRAAARYLNCSYQHCKKWMKVYVDKDTGISLFDSHKNPHGKGIPKFLAVKGRTVKDEPPILDVVEGRVDPSSFTPQKIKFRLIESGFLEERCYKCGFCERRVVDYKMPLILNFKDKNKNHYRLMNLELLCYNCYFLYIDEVFKPEDIIQFEEEKQIFKTSEAVDLELDDYTKSRLKELGLMDEDPDDPYTLVSRPKNNERI